MAVGHEAGPGKIECSGVWVDKAVVGNHSRHIGDKHVVAAKFHDIAHAALDAQRGLLYIGTSYADSGYRCEARLGPLVVVGSGTNSGPVGGAGHVGRGKVDGKLHLLFYYRIAVARAAHRYIAHRRLRAYGACPCHGKHVVALRGIAAGNESRRHGINHVARFPDLLHEADYLMWAWEAATECPQ